MVILFVAHHINHLIDGEIFETQLGRTDVLRHIHRCPVAAQQQFVVEPLCRQVGPYRAVLFPIHDTLFQSFEHFLFPFEIGLRLVIYLIEVHAQATIRLVESGIDPVVHHLPNRTNLGIAGLPFAQHGAGFLHERRGGLGLFGGHAFGFQFFQFLFVMFVEQHIEITDKVVAFFPGLFGGDTVAPLLPSQHRFTDMNTPVIDDIGFHHPIAIGFQNLGKTISQQVVAHMSQM